MVETSNDAVQQFVNRVHGVVDLASLRQFFKDFAPQFSFLAEITESEIAELQRCCRCDVEERYRVWAWQIYYV